MKLTLSKITTIAAVAGLLVSSQAISAPKSGASQFTNTQTQAIENIMKELLAREPELIETAIRTAMSKKEEMAKQQATKYIKSNHNLLFGNKTDPFIGNPNGSEVIVAFMDPYCGYCRRFQSTLVDLTEKRPQLKVIYKAYPVMFPESLQAVEEELAANAQGDFQAFHNVVYNSDASTRDERLKLAQENNINVKGLRQWLPGEGNKTSANKIQEQIAQNIQIGKSLNIHGTPAFIIGTQLYSGAVPEEAVVELLESTKTSN